jgi:beta-phosphoglucomutase
MEQKMKHSIQAIIFDMDGTILDTEPVWERGNRYILSTHAPHLTADQVNEVIEYRRGIRTPDELATMLQKHCTPFMTIAHIREIKTAYVLNLYETEGVSFIPYFHEFHTKLSNFGLQSAIATNSNANALEKIMIKTPLQSYFKQHVYPIDTVYKKYKPSPDIYLHAAKMLEINPKYCVAIEDSPNGIKAAKAAGMYCIGINSRKNRALLTQADEIVDCFSEIDLDKLLNIEKL